MMEAILVLMFLLLMPHEIEANQQKFCPLVFGHRGAAGIYPEHTVIGYENGANLGADYIECDVQITKDLQLICSHDPWMKNICDVEKHSNFADR